MTRAVRHGERDAESQHPEGVGPTVRADARGAAHVRGGWGWRIGVAKWPLPAGPRRAGDACFTNTGSTLAGADWMLPCDAARKQVVAAGITAVAGGAYYLLTRKGRR